MKGSVAAMVTACQRFVETHPDHRVRLRYCLQAMRKGERSTGPFVSWKL